MHLSHCSIQQPGLIRFMFRSKLVWHGPQKGTTNSQISDSSDDWNILQHHSRQSSFKFMDGLRNQSQHLCKKTPKQKKQLLSASF